MVEFAIVGGLFITLLMVIVEGSLLMRNNLTIANITGSAGRAASTFGNDLDADYEIIQEIRHAAAGIGIDRIERIVVFRATGIDDAVPAGCAAGSPTSAAPRPCNVYDTSVFGIDDPADMDCSGSSPSRYFCPLDRRIAMSAPGPDYIGIYVRIQHQSLTGLLGGDRVIERTSIFRLEPQVLN